VPLKGPPLVLQVKKEYNGWENQGRTREAHDAVRKGEAIAAAKYAKKIAEQNIER
jgi:hypothetical protein